MKMMNVIAIYLMNVAYVMVITVAAMDVMIRMLSIIIAMLGKYHPVTII